MWDPATMESANNIHQEFDLNFFGQEVSDYAIRNKWELMGLDNHLQVSVMSNLFEEFIGANNFSTDMQDPSHVTKTFVCQTKSHEERSEQQRRL